MGPDTCAFWLDTLQNTPNSCPCNIVTNQKHQHACLVCFVNPSLQYCYKEKRPTILNASRMFVVFGVFCKPILAMLLQRRRRISRTNHHACLLCLVCFVNPSLQCCYKEDVGFLARIITHVCCVWCVL